MIPLFVTNAFDGEQLPVYGDGKQVRDWLHVADHCAAIEFVMRNGQAGAVYNIGGGCELENIDVVSQIVKLCGADPDTVRHVDDRPGHDRRYSLECSKLRELGWEPERTFQRGLDETVTWYRDNRAWWEPIKTGGYREYYEAQYASRLS